jgi:hypothetical protein
MPGNSLQLQLTDHFAPRSRIDASMSSEEVHRSEMVALSVALMMCHWLR